MRRSRSVQRGITFVLAGLWTVAAVLGMVLLGGPPAKGAEAGDAPFLPADPPGLSQEGPALGASGGRERASGALRATGQVEALRWLWSIQRVDAPKLFKEMTDRSLGVDGNGRPHLAYGGDHLYYAYRDGTGWHRETVDGAFGVGSHAALAVTGTTVVTIQISYYDAAHGDLKYARKDARGQWILETVDQVGDVGRYSSIAIAPRPPYTPHISYYDATNQRLKHAYRDGQGWKVETVDANGNRVGLYTSIAVDSQGNPHIAYIDDWNNIVRYASRNEFGWSTQWVFQNLEGGVGYASLALDRFDDPMISVLRSFDSGLLVTDTLLFIAYDSTLGDWITETVDFMAANELWSSLALDGNDRPHISYAGSLRHATSNGSWWDTEFVDSGAAARYTSIAIGATGPYTLQVSYYDETSGELRYAYWDGTQSKWIVEVVDRGSDDVGQYASLALDDGGVPHISYRSRGRFRLKYATLRGAAWVTQTLGEAWGRTSLAIDGQGRPHISYRASLEYIRWDGSRWVTATIHPGWSQGWYNDLALEPQAPYTPHISYYDYFADDLRYARWDGSKWVSETVDAAGWVGRYTSLALDGQARPHIAYYDASKGDLRYARWDGSRWITGTVDRAGDVGRYASLVLDGQARPHIAYYDASKGDLRYARWDGSRWITGTVDRAGDVGRYASLVLDGQARPHIAYYDASKGDLRYARWDGSRWITETVDQAGDVGQYASLALDRRGNAFIAYYDASSGDLKLALGRRVGAALTGAHQARVRPGETVTYLHVLTNTGSYTDVFTLAYASAQGWASVQPASPITLGPGATATLRVVVAVPAVALSDTVEGTVLTVTSRTDVGVQVSVRDETTVGHKPGVGLSPGGAAKAGPGSTAVHLHVLTNTGNGADAFTLACGGPPGWGTTCAPRSLSLARGATAAVWVTVTVPSTALSGTVGTTVVTATSQADPKVFAAVRDRVTVTRRVALRLDPDGRGEAAPGRPVGYVHRLTNGGNYTDTFVLTYTTTPAWPVQVHPSGPITLPPGAVQTVWVTVTVPNQAPWGATATTVLTATSRADGTVSASVTDVTTAVAPERLFLPLLRRP